MVCQSQSELCRGARPVIFSPWNDTSHFKTRCLEGACVTPARVAKDQDLAEAVAKDPRRGRGTPAAPVVEPARVRLAMLRMCTCGG